MAPTPTIGADLTRRGFARVRLWTRGVNHALYRPRTQRALDLPRPIFLSVGRVAVEKNLEALLGLDLPGSTVIVGDGPARRRLERRYRHAHFLGAKHGETLADIYASADVFVFPSRTDTFGIVLIEAMASGVPVAAFPAPGPIDVVGHGAGVLEEDLSTTCLKALTLPREQARKHSLRFTWKESARQFLDNIETTRSDRRLPSPSPERVGVPGSPEAGRGRAAFPSQPQIQPNQAKSSQSGQRKSKKTLWISLDSLRGIERFQLVTATPPALKIFLSPFLGGRA